MSDIIINKPLPLLLKDIGFDFKSTLIAISKAVASGSMGDAKGACEHIVDMLGSFHISTTPEEEMWVLIATSLRTSLVKTSLEYKELFPSCLDDELQLTDFDIEHEIKKVECAFDRTIFTHPEKTLFIKFIRQPITVWLNYIGLHSYQILSFLNKFESNFVFSLHKEWAENSESYRNISSVLVTPFTTATLKQRKWASYQQSLMMMSKDRVFNEIFCLDEVYVPLRGYFIEKNKEESKKVVDINSFLMEWLHECNLKDPLKLISGGPGCGKSSLTKMLSSDICKNNYWNVLYIPLHHFDLQEDLFYSISKYTSQNAHIGFDVIDVDSGFDRLVLIFDGLDELSMQGKAASETALRFIDELVRILYRVNSQGRAWQAIVTGRDISIQSSEAVLKNEGQIVHVLPYYLNNSERIGYKDTERLLSIDQRNVWWQKFGLVTGRNYKTFPPELNNGDLNPITREPLLNYLVSYSYVSGNLDLSENISLNKIYEELLSQVHSRNYESRRHINTDHLSFDEFIEILEEIAITVWKGKNGRTATEREIYNGCVDNGLGTHLERFSEGAEKGVVRLLTAFYFRQFGSNSLGDRTFEFTHKSFGEYLSARRILEEVKYLSTQLRLRTKSRRQGVDLDTALIKWIEMFGSTRLDKYVGVFLTTELEKYSIEEVRAWQVSLGTLLNVSISDGLPIEKTEISTFSNMLSAYKYSLETLFFIHNCCALYTKEMEILSTRNTVVLGECINTIRDYSGNGVPSLISESLGGLIISDQDLSLFNFRRFSFKCGEFLNVILSKSNMSDAMFIDFSIKNSNFTGLKSNEIIISKSKVINTDFRYLVGTRLQLHSSKFTKCNFMGLESRYGNIEYCDFIRSKFSDASFQSCAFEKVLFEGGRFLSVCFSGSKFTDVKFENINLSSIDFSKTTLKNVTFINIKKSNFNFLGATLENVKFIQVNINPEDLYSQAKICSGVEIELRDEIEELAYNQNTGVITW